MCIRDSPRHPKGWGEGQKTPCNTGQVWSSHSATSLPVCICLHTTAREQCGTGTHQLEEEEVEHIREEGMGRGLSGSLAEVNGVTCDAVSPLPAAHVHLESLTFDGHQL